MPGTFFLGPQRVDIDSNKQVVLAASTITASGSSAAYQGFGTARVTLKGRINGAVGGTTPTLEVKIEELDPGDLATVIATHTTGTMNPTMGSGFELEAVLQADTVRVSWVVGGTSPSFADSYLTLTSSISVSSRAEGDSVTDSELVPEASMQIGADSMASGSFQRVRGHNLNQDYPTSDQEVALGVSLRAPGLAGSVAMGTDEYPIRAKFFPSQTVLQNATITSGSTFPLSELNSGGVAIVIRVGGTVSGAGATLRFRLREYEIGSSTRVLQEVTHAPITAPTEGAIVLCLALRSGNVAELKYEVSGTSPSFGGVYVTMNGLGGRSEGPLSSGFEQLVRDPTDLDGLAPSWATQLGAVIDRERFERVRGHEVARGDVALGVSLRSQGPGEVSLAAGSADAPFHVSDQQAQETREEIRDLLIQILDRLS